MTKEEKDFHELSPVFWNERMIEKIEHSCFSLVFLWCFLSISLKLFDLVIHTVAITEKHCMVNAVATDGLLRKPSSQMLKNVWCCHLPLIWFNCNISFIKVFFFSFLLHFGLHYWLNVHDFLSCDQFIQLNLIKAIQSDQHLRYWKWQG